MEEGNCSKEGNKRWTEAIKGGREGGRGGREYRILLCFPNRIAR